MTVTFVLSLFGIFALGFSCGVLITANIRTYAITPKNSGVSVGNDTKGRPGRPDNEKARRYMTLQRRQEMEQVLTKGHGYG